MKYIKQLDSLRALAILTVIIVHWFPKDSFFYTLSENFHAPAIFFTLSGFLITYILLKDRLKAEVLGTSKVVIFRSFFLKRALRIFPGYFLVLAVFYFFKPVTSEVIEFKYFVTFTANIYINKIQQWPALAHLWSMSVEEQFYLVWPCLMLFTNKKYLVHVIILTIIIGVGSQLLLPQNEFSGVLTNNCFNSLAIGALLAWTIINEPQILKLQYKKIAGIAAASFLLLLVHFNLHQFYFIDDQTLVSLITAWLVVFLMVKEEDSRYLFSFLLENKILMRLGRMSYGLYLYHFIIPYYTYQWFLKLNSKLHLPENIRQNQFIWIAENFCLLLVVSAVSYKFFELPILRCKKYFRTPDLRSISNKTRTSEVEELEVSTLKREFSMV